MPSRPPARAPRRPPAVPGLAQEQPSIPTAAPPRSRSARTRTCRSPGVRPRRRRVGDVGEPARLPGGGAQERQGRRQPRASHPADEAWVRCRPARCGSLLTSRAGRQLPAHLRGGRGRGFQRQPLRERGDLGASQRSDPEPLLAQRRLGVEVRRPATARRWRSSRTTRLAELLLQVTLARSPSTASSANMCDQRVWSTHPRVCPVSRRRSRRRPRPRPRDPRTVRSSGIRDWCCCRSRGIEEEAAGQPVSCCCHLPLIQRLAKEQPHGREEADRVQVVAVTVMLHPALLPRPMPGQPAPGCPRDAVPRCPW